MSAIPTAARKAVRFRDFERCCICSSGNAHEIHHRIRRREGGHALSNITLLCSVCHHQKVHGNPEWAREHGWIVPTWGDTREVPIDSWRGRITLNDEGAVAFVE